MKKREREQHVPTRVRGPRFWESEYRIEVVDVYNDWDDANVEDDDVDEDDNFSAYEEDLWHNNITKGSFKTGTFSYSHTHALSSKKITLLRFHTHTHTHTHTHIPL